MYKETLKIKLRPNIFEEAKFEARRIFEARTKFEAKPNVRPKVRPGQSSCQARPGQVRFKSMPVVVKNARSKNYERNVELLIDKCGRFSMCQLNFKNITLWHLFLMVYYVI